MSNQTLSRYYLGRESGPLTLSEDDMAKIAQELFYDFVSIGALTLPTGTTADSYKVESNGVGDIALKGKNKRDQALIVRSAKYWIDAHTKMDHYNVTYILNNTKAALQVIG